jgi:hypothetical protein
MGRKGSVTKSGRNGNAEAFEVREKREPAEHTQSTSTMGHCLEAGKPARQVGACATAYLELAGVMSELRAWSAEVGGYEQ